MDEWLKNWIDEWSEEYDRLEAEKQDNQKKKVSLSEQIRLKVFGRIFNINKKVKV
ncbi:MAG: hypothetical protein QF440_03385 [Candidatus Thalassarchaeaceae archaeon]|jgi:hypothetical protein|nr:hypothetical protein [Candidatus Thalassarchaeaceae archaeon]